jgi:hypothetical protein
MRGVNRRDAYSTLGLADVRTGLAKPPTTPEEEHEDEFEHEHEHEFECEDEDD